MEFKPCDIQKLMQAYPQLTLPLRAGISQTQEYRDVVLKGESGGRVSPWHYGEIQQGQCFTPAGTANILYLPKRKDFEQMYQALGFRCEPTRILPSVGAAFINGLPNWNTIREHQAAYLRSGKFDLNEEFVRFTSDRKNYCDSLILLSRGAYSSIPAERAGFPRGEWETLSLKIRMYHELTHFVCRRLFPEKKDKIRDEIIADGIGLLAAFGRYDPSMACMFLGIEEGSFRPGGRLEEYADNDVQTIIPEAERLIREMEDAAITGWGEEEWLKLPEKEKEPYLFRFLTEIY